MRTILPGALSLLASLTLSTAVLAQPAEPPAEEPAGDAPAEEPAAEEPAEEPAAEEPAAEEPAAEEPASEPPPAEQPAQPPAESQPPAGGQPDEGAPPPASDSSSNRGSGFTFGASTRGGDPTADTGAKDEDPDDARPKGAPRVRWRGTALSWGHTVTTTALGVGRDNIGSENEQYVMSYNGVLNYYLIDGKGPKLRVAAQPSFAQEMTDSNATTKERELLFQDLPLQAVTSVPLYSDPDSLVSTGLLFNGTIILPTSKFSQEAGINLTTSPRALLFQTIPLLGKDSVALKSISFGAAVRWDHTFTDATEPVNDDLNRPRQTATGSTFISDQLTGQPLTQDSLRYTAFFMLIEQYGLHQVQLIGGAQLVNDYHTGFEAQECEVELLTGCTEADRLENSQSRTTSTGVFISANYFPRTEFGFGLGYSNAAGQLAPDGSRRNMFYSPAATFNASLIVSLDAIYEGLTGPMRTQPFVLVGKNDRKRKDQRSEERGPRRATATF